MTKVHATALTHERALSIVQEVHQGKGYDWSLFQYKGAREKVDNCSINHYTTSILSTKG